MPKKALRKTLPKDLDALLDAAAASGDDSAVRAALSLCDPNARSGFGAYTPLMNGRCTPELARWLVARGTDVNALDTWGATALHAASFARFNHRLTPDVLLDLGADVHSAHKYGLTPLHSAADGKNVASAQVLLAHDAKIDALNSGGLTPLEYGLSRMSNIDLVAMVPFAKFMLAAGAVVTPKAQESVKTAAERFEFHRAKFNPESVQEYSDASAELCALFGVEPPARRKMHDGKSPIVATGSTWRAQHQSLWELLVPSSGASDTVQGEVVRISGRVIDELRRNGGGNWDEQYDAMVAALVGHLGSHTSLAASDVEKARAAQRVVRRDQAAPDLLAELAVRWVAANPTPVPLPKPSYRR